MTPIPECDRDKVVLIDYTNHRGERSLRTIYPYQIAFKSTEWHPDEQHILEAYDFEKGAPRDFAMKDIHSWAPKDTASGRAMESVFKQLQRSIEKNGRMVGRLRRLLDRCIYHQPTHEAYDAVSAIEAILKDKEL